MSETPDQPLLRSPSQQTAVNVGVPAQGSTRAYKVAGITLLACVLIVGQAAIAYFLLSQRRDIISLQVQTNGLKAGTNKGPSVSAPMHMRTGMAAVPLQMGDFVEEEASTGSPVPLQSTKCQLEALGLKHLDVPGFRPACDERGLYKTQQCWQQSCWCVNAVTGDTIPNTLRQGPAQCNRATFRAGMVQFQPLTETDA